MSECEGQGQSDNQTSKMKTSEMQIYIILLLVTFGFLILATPAYVFFFYVMYVDYWKSARSLVEYHLFNHVAGHAHLTNYGINFFLYVISGRKFRSDLLHLFKCGRIKESEVPSSNQSNITKDTSA